jgi:hypothetical protein
MKTAELAPLLDRLRAESHDATLNCACGAPAAPMRSVR